MLFMQRLLFRKLINVQLYINSKNTLFANLNICCLTRLDLWSGHTKLTFLHSCIDIEIAVGYSYIKSINAILTFVLHRITQTC